MARIWALVASVGAAGTLMALLVGFVGTEALLTMSVPISIGVAAAYIQGDAFISRGAWLFGGVLLGAVGFAIGASAYPDTTLGLWLGLVVPAVIFGAATFATKRQSNFLAALLGSAALSGVYTLTFDADPQSLNVSLPIAVGQAVLPLGFGYLAGMTVRMLVPSDAPGTQPRTLVDLGGGGAEEAPVRPVGDEHLQDAR
jgi:uncharacterized membrane protein YwaF